MYTINTEKFVWKTLYPDLGDCRLNLVKGGEISPAFYVAYHTTVNSEIIACIYYCKSCNAGDNASFNIAI